MVFTRPTHPVETSDFNDALGFLNRMNRIFYTINVARMNLDLYEWINSLGILKSELTNDMSDYERGNHSNKFYTLMHRVNIQVSKNNQLGTNSVPADLFRELDRFEESLRIIYNRAGYQTRRADDPNRAII